MQDLPQSTVSAILMILRIAGMLRIILRPLSSCMNIGFCGTMVFPDHIMFGPYL